MLEYQKLCQISVSQIFLELAETTKAEGFIAKDLDQDNYAYAPEAQKVGHKDKLFPKTPIINVQSAQEAFSDKVNFIWIIFFIIL